MQRHARVVHKALEELVHQLRIELADARGGEGHVHTQAGAARKIDHHARQRLIQRHVGVAIAANAFFVAHGLGKSLAQGDADVFHGVVAVDVQVTGAFHVQIDQAVARNLVQHVVQKANTGIEAGNAGAVQVDAHAHARLGGVALHLGGARRGGGHKCMAAHTDSFKANNI